MSTHSTGTKSPTTFEIKSAQIPLLAFLLKSVHLEQIAVELAACYGDTPDFFDHEPLIIDLTPLPPGTSHTTIDWSGLCALLIQYRLHPVAVRGTQAQQLADAQRLGLAIVSETLRHPSESSSVPSNTASAPAGAAHHRKTLLIDKPLRSGQQIYARGADLVVTAMVNPGAEIIADGHIHIYAPLRGKAIAGALGDTEARIFALIMEAELISIAGIYRTSELAFPADIWGKNVQISLHTDPLGEHKLHLVPMQAQPYPQTLPTT